MNNSAHIPAEWELDSDILLAWPHRLTDWEPMLNDVHDCYISLIDNLLAAGHRVWLICPTPDIPSRLTAYDTDRLIRLTYLTNDTWTRDYGPLTMRRPDGSLQLLDFAFNGWGLKFAANRDNLVNSELENRHVLNVPMIHHLDFVLEGGGIESDGRGTILTTARCQMSANRNGGPSNPGLETRLRTLLGADRVIMLNHGYLAGDDTDSHIDTLARIAPHDSIIYVGCDNPDDEHYQELQAMKQEIQQLRTADGNPYNLVELPLPDPIFDDDGERLPATYANYLATTRGVFMPVYGQKRKDLLAKQMLQIVFEQPVYTVDCRALIRQHGSLHCATMQIPSSTFSI